MKTLTRPLLRGTAALLLAAGGFRIGQLQTGYLKGPRPMTHVYRGWAD